MSFRPLFALPDVFWHGKSSTPKIVSYGLRKMFLFTVIFSVLSSAVATPFPSSGPTVPGSTARLCSGVAAAPSSAPLLVKRAIWAGNQLRRKPYRYGGGHRSFFDKGYDCSGTVSYALAAAGLVRSPLSSRDLRSFGSRGCGKWITIYARNGHTFAVIAGLRLDTTAWNESVGNWAPRWQTTFREPRGFQARHPVGL